MNLIRYTPMRIRRMGLRRELTRHQVKAAAMFCYFEEHQWLLWSTVGTNFPNGHKVDTSAPGTRSMRSGASQAQPVDYNLLRDALLEAVPFPELYRRHGGRGVSNREAHRRGKKMLVEALDRFAVLLGD